MKKNILVLGIGLIFSCNPILPTDPSSIVESTFQNDEAVFDADVPGGIFVASCVGSFCFACLCGCYHQKRYHEEKEIMGEHIPLINAETKDTRSPDCSRGLKAWYFGRRFYYCYYASAAIFSACTLIPFFTERPFGTL